MGSSPDSRWMFWLAWSDSRMRGFMRTPGIGGGPVISKDGVSVSASRDLESLRGRPASLAPRRPRRAFQERKWLLSAPLFLEIRSAERPSLQPGFGRPSAQAGFKYGLVEVLEVSEKRLRVRFMGAARPVSWIPRDSVSGVIVNGQLRREDVEVRLEAALAVRAPSTSEGGVTVARGGGLTAP